MQDNQAKLRTDPLWKSTYSVVEHVYDKLEAIIEAFPDEKWATATKLRNSANDSMFYVAQALGNATPETAKYDWNNARKYLFAMQSMYIFAGKQQFLAIDPEIVVKIDHIIKEIDTKMTASEQAAKQKDQEDMEPWLEKYRLWQKINS